VTEPREALAEISARIVDRFGEGLRGLYLFGSLAAGAFCPGKSDIDLLAVVAADVHEGEDLEALRSLHAEFVSEHPAWVERVEVGYVSEAVLQTFGEDPRGPIALISPGEPLHVKEVGADWTLNWRGVCTEGETIVGPPPLELGPEVTQDAYKRSIEAQLDAWKVDVRAPWVAYVPAVQGYIAVTLCRALYGLATGEQTTKENAVSWASERYPEWARFLDDALTAHRADVSEAHQATIRFVDEAFADAGRVKRRAES
jgi:predicted nucleotidyltransferase